MDSMEYEISKMTPSQCYKLLSSLIVPRPIAFITTVDTDGKVNAAPFSYFNIMGSDPPIVAIGIGKDNLRKNGLKDSAHNIQQTREFVINIVNESIIKQVNITSIDFPPGFDEAEIAGFTKTSSTKIRPPRILEAPANLECVHSSTIEIGNTRITLGEVVHLHVSNEFVDKNNNILTELIQPVGRMHGRGFYTRTRDLFNLPRQTYEEWKKQKENK